MLHLAETDGTVPLLLQVRLLHWHVTQLRKQSVGLLVRVSEDTRLEQELLEFNEHASLLQTVRLLTLSVDHVQLLQVGQFEDRLDFRIHQGVELLVRGTLQMGQVVLGLGEVRVS